MASWSTVRSAFPPMRVAHGYNFPLHPTSDETRKCLGPKGAPHHATQPCLRPADGGSSVGPQEADPVRQGLNWTGAASLEALLGRAIACHSSQCSEDKVAMCRVVRAPRHIASRNRLGGPLARIRAASSRGVGAGVVGDAGQAHHPATRQGRQQCKVIGTEDWSEPPNLPREPGRTPQLTHSKHTSEVLSRARSSRAALSPRGIRILERGRVFIACTATFDCTPDRCKLAACRLLLPREAGPARSHRFTLKAAAQRTIRCRRRGQSHSLCTNA